MASEMSGGARGRKIVLAYTHLIYSTSARHIMLV
jgi:hypothetical protein